MTLLAFIAPATARNILLVLIGGGYLAYRLYPVWRWWRRRVSKPEVEVEERNGAQTECPQRKLPTNNEAALCPDCGGQGTARPTVSTPRQTIQPSSNPPIEQSKNPTPPTSLSGEELCAKALAMPHQPVPDFDFDGEFLELLGQSAATGYAPAMAKLGEYAMRRAAWVEAYYWMTLAKRNGMLGLLPILREIRQNWVMAGFPDEVENEYRLFPAEAGSLGRALLHLDSGRDAAAAREFLTTHHPEFLFHCEKSPDLC